MLYCFTELQASADSAPSGRGGAQTGKEVTVVRIKAIGKAILIWILAVLWLPVGSLAEDDTDVEAQDLTGSCTFSVDGTAYGSFPRSLSDDSLETKRTLHGGRSFAVSWTDGVPVRAVFAEFFRAPSRCTILQYDAEGAELSREACPAAFNYLIPVGENTRSVAIASEDTIEICSLHAYGSGTVPNAHPWDYAVKKLDYMVVAMHPDDDVLFLGAIVPIFGAEQGKEGRILYATPARRYRTEEALNGAWTMGLRNAPLFGPFGDFANESDPGHQKKFGKEAVVRYLVRVFREHRPDVVFSHDPNGEYGHWQHRRLSECVRRAVVLSADPSYDPESAAAFGTWRVKKLYLHLYPENAIQLSVTAPLAAFGGKSAFDVASEAYACHISQQATKHRVRSEGVYSLSDFGLAYSAVGPDTPGKNDPFEHLSPEELFRLSLRERFGRASVRDGLPCGTVLMRGGMPR